LSAFSLLFGIFLFIQLINSLGEVLPFFELCFGAFGIQLLVTPFLDYYYFHSDIFGIMQVDEYTYFSFVTYAILAFYIGYKILPKKNNEAKAKLEFVQNKKQFEFIGERLVWIGYVFYFLSLVSSNFIVTAFAFLRFIGTFYLFLSQSKKSRLYLPLVWIPFILLTFKSSVFINLIIFSSLFYSLFILLKRPNKLTLYSLIIVSFFFILVLQTVKHDYRKVVWYDNSSEKVSLIELMINQVKSLDSEMFFTLGSNLNIRVNQGWVISHGLSNLNPDRYKFESSNLMRELIGIILPRFLYADKVTVGSHEKFYLFSGYSLSDSTSMNIGIIGDAYLNFGLVKGIIACFILGLFFSFFHNFYLQKLLIYPDLLVWSVFFYFMIMRANNEFYIIMNWFVKTGLITFLFFKYVRPYLLKQSKTIQIIRK
jgi:hypothetical protein